MGNKKGAVEAITALEEDGLGMVITNKTQGTAKVVLTFLHDIVEI